MPTFFQFAREQYQLVLGSRQALFAYLNTIPQQDLVRENSGFGKGSIRNLLIHCVNTYNFWIGECVLGITAVQINPATVADMYEMQQLYRKVDAMLQAFFDKVEGTGQLDFSFYLGGQETSDSALKLFSHVITHEYHHKGQILSMSRQLGFTPVDTDIMR